MQIRVTKTKGTLVKNYKTVNVHMSRQISYTLETLEYMSKSRRMPKFTELVWCL